MTQETPTPHSPELPAFCTTADGKPVMTLGRRLHNELTYRGVDFALNSAIGVGFTYWTTRTHSGRACFGEPVTQGFKTLLSPLVKNEQSLNTGAHWGSMFTSIILGGTLIIPPMMALEDKKNKSRIVRWIDEHYYGKEAVANNPHFQACYDDIAGEPRKNFTTGMAARIAVLTPMIAMTVFDKTNEPLVKYFYNPIGRASKAMCKGLGMQPKGLMERGMTETVQGAPKFVSDWEFIHRTIGFDAGLTFIYSYAHEKAYKGLAALGMRENEAENTPASATPSSLVHIAHAHQPEMAERGLAI